MKLLVLFLIATLVAVSADGVIEDPNVATGALGLPLSWNNIEVSDAERARIIDMKDILSAIGGKGTSKGSADGWLRGSTDIEKLRFLRQANGNAKKAVDGMIAHSNWRTSPNGAETIMREYKDEFENHILNDEFYWIGPSKDDGCPTLVIRSQLHDGRHYNDDNKYFVKYVTYVLEKGVRKYGIGSETEFCMIIDRTDATARDGSVKKDTFDLSVLPNMVDLLKTSYAVLFTNYPKLLKRSQVLPSTWFFATCWNVARRFLDPSIHQKFEIIQNKDISDRLTQQFALDKLPHRFGGTADDFLDDFLLPGGASASASASTRVSSTTTGSRSGNSGGEANDTTDTEKQWKVEPSWLHLLVDGETASITTQQ